MDGRAQASDLDGLRSFANNIQRDLDAVTAGLSLPYSSDPVGQQRDAEAVACAKFTRTAVPQGQHAER